MKQTHKPFDLYEVVNNKVITELERGVIPWQKPWAASGPPMNAITRRPYQGINHWLLLSLNYESNLFLTYDQVRGAGGYVKRGAKAHMIMYWDLREPKHADAAQETSEVLMLRPMLRYHRVFNVSQCEGLPASILETGWQKPMNPIAACENIVVGMPNAPEIRFGGTLAFYHLTRDYVNMPKMSRFKDAESYYGVLFHELNHSTAHAGRLNRPTISQMGGYGSENYSIEELVAELGACYLCAYVGIEKYIKNNASYIQSWLSQLRSDKRMLLHASSYAQKSVNYILGIRAAPDDQNQSSHKPDDQACFVFLHFGGTCTSPPRAIRV